MKKLATTLILSAILAAGSVARADEFRVHYSIRGSGRDSL
jgi:hypothetical protein